MKCTFNVRPFSISFHKFCRN
ncbi:hypothetical protein [Alteromonas macleodii]